MPEQLQSHKTSKWRIREKRQFLVAAMTEFAGGEAHVSFEGDLSATRVLEVTGASTDETSILKRNTIRPIQDFVVLPLELGLVPQIIAGIGGTIPRGILHIQIEKDGRLEIGLYDGPRWGSLFWGPDVSDGFLQRLESEDVIRRIVVP